MIHDHNEDDAITVLDASREWYDAGFSVCPAKEDGSKQPAAKTWKDFQSKRVRRDDLPRLMGAFSGLGVFPGRVHKADNSGYEDYGVECFEFDSEAAFETFLSGLEAAGLSWLVARIRNGYEERTPSGGVHLFYFCPTVEGNTKLAQEPTGDLDEHGNPVIKTLIETRALGGWVIVASSHGRVHPSGKPYVRTQGSPATIAHITTEERAALFAYARTFDRTPHKQARDSSRFDSTGSTGHASRRVQAKFNSQATWDGVLHDWEFIGESNGVGEWRRPGAETSGKDATTNADGTDRLWVHSSSTVFDVGRYYTKFQAYAVLNHGGDHAEAEAEIEANWDDWTAEGESVSTSDPKRPRFEFLTIDDYRTRTPPAYLIHGVTQARSLTMTYGDFATFKSFVALDMALSVAAGIPWQGHRTNQGPTAYVVGEGGGHFLKRVDAWLKHHGIGSIPGFYLLADAPQLNADADLKPFLAAFKAIPDVPVLTVIDTLARTYAGNENGQEDMNRYVKAASDLQKLGSAVNVLHHAGKDGKYRGSSALPGAADTIVRLDRKGESVRVKNEKMKDDEEFEPLTLKAEVVTLSEPPTDPDAIDLKPVTSLVMVRDDSAAEPSDTLTPAQVTVLTVLFDAGEAGLTSSEWHTGTGMSKSTYTDAVKVLKTGEYVTPNNPFQTPKGTRFKVTAKGRDLLEPATGEGDES